MKLGAPADLKASCRLMESPAVTHESVLAAHRADVASGAPRLDWTLYDFYYALARRGGHQNRKHDHPPGWLVLWRGWTYLQAMPTGATAADTG